MKNISIGIYSVRIYDSKQNEDIDVKNNSYSIKLEDIICNYFKVMKRKGKINKQNKSLVIIDKIFESPSEELSGIIKTGEYGEESEGYDIDSIEGKSIDEQTVIVENIKKTYTKSKNTAEVLPFVFSFDFKNQSNKKLYLALERFGQFGIKTKLEQELNFYLKKCFPTYRNLSIKIHDLISQRVINEYYKKEGFRSLTLKKFTLPNDIADKFRNNGANSDDYMIEYKIKSKKRGGRLPFFNKVENFLSNDKKDIKTVFEIRNNKDFQYDNIVGELIVNNQVKKVDFSNFLKFKAYRIVNVDRKDNGHPNERQLLEKMREILGESIVNIEIV